MNRGQTKVKHFTTASEIKSIRNTYISINHRKLLLSMQDSNEPASDDL